MPEIHGMTWEGIEKLGFDENNNLYWDGKPVLTRRKIRLPWFVNVAAIIASLSTAPMAAASAASGNRARPPKFAPGSGSMVIVIACLSLPAIGAAHGYHMSGPNHYGETEQQGRPPCGHGPICSIFRGLIIPSSRRPWRARRRRRWPPKPRRRPQQSRRTSRFRR